MTELSTERKAAKITPRSMAYCALFTALIAIGAFIKIPIPYIPITFQVMFVLLAGMLLGPKLGALSVVLYVVIGLVGFPIFTQGGGIGYVLQPTFGYLIGFIPAAYLTGWIVEKGAGTKVSYLFLAQLAGVGVIYAIGMTYFYMLSNYYVNNPVSWGALFMSSFLATLPKDLILSFLAAVLAKKVIPILSRSGK